VLPSRAELFVLTADLILIVLLQARFPQARRPRAAQPRRAVCSDCRSDFNRAAAAAVCVCCRRDFLKPGGLVLPSRAELFVSGVEDREALSQAKAAWDVPVAGLSLSSAMLQVSRRGRVGAACV